MWKYLSKLRMHQHNGKAYIVIFNQIARICKAFGSLINISFIESSNEVADS